MLSLKRTRGSYPDTNVMLVILCLWSEVSDLNHLSTNAAPPHGD